MFPWWLVMLVGLWAAGLTCWLNERCSPSLRNYAGACCLAYTFLLWFVLSSGQTVPVDSPGDGGPVSALRLCAGLSLTSALGLLGLGPPKRRMICLIIFGLSTGGVCLCLGKPVIAGVCLAAAGCAVRLKETTPAAADAWPFRTANGWLTGLATGMLALGLLGAVRGTFRVDSAPQTTATVSPHRPQPLNESSAARDGMLRQSEFPWLAAGLLVTALALWDAERTAAMEPTPSSEMDRTS